MSLDPAENIKEAQKFEKIMHEIKNLNPSIPSMSLIIRELSNEIAFKHTMQKAIHTIDIKKLKTEIKKPRTIDEFLAKTVKKK